ncbi:hypothetical protein MMC25_003619 [Agyrium rufum]|nr:hypothetical protein [Agyrium rufum]
MSMANTSDYPPGAQVPDWETPSGRSGHKQWKHGRGLSGIGKFVAFGRGQLHQSSTNVQPVTNLEHVKEPDQQYGVSHAPNQAPLQHYEKTVQPSSHSRNTGRWSNLSKKRKIIILGIALILVVLILAIGLGVRLSKRGHRFLPLPTDKQTFHGDLTYYGTGLGACGVTSADKDDIVSVSHYLFDAQSTGSNPNANPLCGRKIRAERFDQSVNANRSIHLTVVDRCTGCQPTDLDVSPGAFSQLADQALGRVTVNWAWIS